MTGPAPTREWQARTFPGIWQVEAEPRGPGLFGLGESPICNSKYFRNILSDFKPGEENRLRP